VKHTNKDDGFLFLNENELSRKFQIAFCFFIGVQGLIIAVWQTFQFILNSIEVARGKRDIDLKDIFIILGIIIALYLFSFFVLRKGIEQLRVRKGLEKKDSNLQF